MREIAEAEVAMLGEIFQRFVEKSPIAVMVRGVLERVLGAEALDAWYEQTAQKQYTRTLLFSTLYELMSAVVFAIKPSVHAAYQGREAEVGASIVSVLSQAQGDRAADLGGTGSVQCDGPSADRGADGRGTGAVVGRVSGQGY